MSDSTIVYLIILAAVVLFVSNRLPVELVAVCVALSLYFTDVLTLEQAIAGFGEPVVIFIAALFVVAESLEATGVTAWASQQLTARAGSSYSRLLVLTMLLVAIMSAVVTPNGAVAALVPVVVVLALRAGKMPSQMLLPLSYASFGGALLTLSGSPVNVIVSDASRQAGGGGFNFFEFAIVGVPLLVGTIGVALTLGPRLIPRRQPQSMPADFSEHARTLLNQYALDQPIYRLRVLPGSSLVGVAYEDVAFEEHEGVTAISAQAQGISGPVQHDKVRVGDMVVLRGPSEAIQEVASYYGLEMGRTVPSAAADLFTTESGVAEVVIPPRSDAIGQTVFPGMVTSSGDLVVMAVQRGGEARAGRTRLQAGDTMLLRGRWPALDAGIADPEILAIDEPDRIRRQLVPLGSNARLTLVILGAMIVALAMGRTPPAIVALTAAAALIALRIVSVQQAYRSISWTVVILIGAMIPLSTAITETGAAADIASVIVDAVGGGSPYLLLIALFILVAVMGQFLSNTATTIIVIPIAIAAAIELDVSIQPVLMSLNVASSASFFTPIATTPNLMILEPGGLRFADYWKFGLPLMFLYFLVGVFLVPLVWSF